jgi:hypothetical protein
VRFGGALVDSAPGSRLAPRQVHDAGGVAQRSQVQKRAAGMEFNIVRVGTERNDINF